MAKQRKVMVVCLPGMDGTGRLFEGFLKAAPEWAEPVAVGYPTDKRLGYEELAEAAKEHVPKGRRFVVVAESFSGGVGVTWCAQKPEGLMGLVLVNSFVTPPGGGVMRWIPWRLAFGVPVLSVVVKAVLTNGPSALGAWEVKKRVDAVRADVLAFRAGLIARMDMRGKLGEVAVPTLVLRGRQDRLVGAGKAREMARLNGGVSVREMDGPHLLLQARPGEAWQEIEEWGRGLTLDVGWGM